MYNQLFVGGNMSSYSNINFGVNVGAYNGVNVCVCVHQIQTSIEYQ